ncbi:hypothetical protein [Acinetobacter puyangensis]|uniref:hypothetical protein n=1 Tax=Acinetobacter puyangensis TaxID=1096779 RepID=UPI003A4D8EBC
MGVKKLVTMTVEVQIEITLGDWAQNPTTEDIDGINYCGFDVATSDDIYKEAALIVIRGNADSNNDVFGRIYSNWSFVEIQNPEQQSFYAINNLYVEDFTVEAR